MPPSHARSSLSQFCLFLSRHYLDSVLIASFSTAINLYLRVYIFPIKIESRERENCRQSHLICFDGQPVHDRDIPRPGCRGNKNAENICSSSHYYLESIEILSADERRSLLINQLELNFRLRSLNDSYKFVDWMKPQLNYPKKRKFTGPRNHHGVSGGFLDRSRGLVLLRPNMPRQRERSIGTRS